jgi:hypothetical protein
VSFAAYYDGNLRRFVLDSEGNICLSKQSSILQETEKKPKIIIVGRKYYQEKIANYPIESVKELKKLLLLENHQTSGYFHAIVAKTEHGNTVNSWRVLSDAPLAIITIPESVLLAFSVDNKQLLVQNISLDVSPHTNESILYVLREEQKTYSQVKSKQISNEQLFRLSVGAASTDTKFGNADMFSHNLQKGLANLPIALFKSFVSFRFLYNRKQLLKNTLIPLMSVMVLYLAVTSGYLLYKNHNLDEELTAQASSVNQSLSQQQRMDELISEYQYLDEFLSTKSNNAALWLILVDFLNEVQFTQIRTNLGEYQLQGITTKATDILEQFIKHPKVFNASFESPTRITKNGELFSISIKLRAEARSQSQQALQDSKFIGNRE